MFFIAMIVLVALPFVGFLNSDPPEKKPTSITSDNLGTVITTNPPQYIEPKTQIVKPMEKPNANIVR